MRLEAMALEKVRQQLLHGRGRVENAGGWCVFVDQGGRRHFVVDGERWDPVPYKSFKFSDRLAGATFFIRSS